MSKKTYLGVNDKSKEIKKIYIGVEGLSKRVKLAYIGDENGKSKLCFVSMYRWEKWSCSSTSYSYTYYARSSWEDLGEFTETLTLKSNNRLNPSTGEFSVYGDDVVVYPGSNTTGYLVMPDGNLGRYKGSDSSMSYQTAIEKTGYDTDYYKGSDFYGYVESSDINAYPSNGKKDNYWYVKVS